MMLMAISREPVFCGFEKVAPPVVRASVALNFCPTPWRLYAAFRPASAGHFARAGSEPVLISVLTPMLKRDLISACGGAWFPEPFDLDFLMPPPGLCSTPLLPSSRRGSPTCCGHRSGRTAADSCPRCLRHP